ncbi:MAG: serine protease [Patescibacteria group bacterium]
MPLLSIIRAVALYLFLIIVVAGASLLVPAAPVVVPGAPLAIVEEPTQAATTTLSIATTSLPTPKGVGAPIESAGAKPAATSTPVVTPPITISLEQAIQSINNLASTSSVSSVNDRVRQALVNIICTTAVGGPFNSISASGVLIDPRGVIITNAHVAQFYLLRDYQQKDFVSCIVRTGSPAQPMYNAELMFIPPTWIEENASKVDDEVPTGNGEHDYALLRITGTVSSSATLPSQFPFLLIALNTPPSNTEVVVAGYAAGFLGGITVQKDLYASSAVSRIGQIYTYGGDMPDVYSVGGTVVAQHGSSGGPVAISDTGVLTGVIVTATDAAETSQRDLRAISTQYIISDFLKERGKSLESALADPVQEAADFQKTTVPRLTNILINALSNN